MAQPPVIQIIARIISLTHLLGIPWLRQFQLSAFAKNFEQDIDLVIFKGIFNLGPVYETTPSRAKARSLLSVGCQSLLLGRRVLIAPLRWSSTPGCSICYSSPRPSRGRPAPLPSGHVPGAASSFALDNPHLDEDRSENIVAGCLDESLRCHTAFVSHSEFSDPLNEVFA